MGVDLAERGVDRGGLAGAGRADDEKHPIWLVDDLPQLPENQGPKADRVEPPGHHAARRAQQPHHEFLAVARRRRRDADLEAVGSAMDGERPVLRTTAFRDIHVGDHFDRRDHSLADHAIHFIYVAQHAIDASPHEVGLLLGFEVDVRGLDTDGLEHHVACVAHIFRHHNACPVGVTVHAHLDRRRAIFLEERKAVLGLGVDRLHGARMFRTPDRRLAHATDQVGHLLSDAKPGRRLGTAAALQGREHIGDDVPQAPSRQVAFGLC